LGIKLAITEGIDQQQASYLVLRFDDGMTVAAVKRIVSSLTARLVDRKSYKFTIETNEVLTE